MKLKVQYMAQLRAALGRSEEEVDLPAGSNLATLLGQLAAGACRGSESHLLTSAGQVRPSLLVVVNGSALPASKADATTLHDGDVVMLLPPIAGG